jgi:DNA-binding NarL/FixJ family response regulator
VLPWIDPASKISKQAETMVRLMDRTNYKAPWTNEQVAELTVMLAAGRTIREIADAMGRSQEAVRGKAWKLGLLADRKQTAR